MGLLNQTQKQYYDTNPPAIFGDYQFTSLEEVVNQFIIAYVGEGKIIKKVKKTEVFFHAQRALQELSYDTLKCSKSQEIVIPPSLTMVLPQDYVNYVKVTWSDSSGIEHVLYPAAKTSNPLKITQNELGVYQFTGANLTTTNDSTTWQNYKSQSSNSQGVINNYNNESNNTNASGFGQLYGLDPQYSQANGSFYIDHLTGKIHFGSSMNSKTVILHYISDSLGTDGEMIVPKFAEEAMYKCIAYAILSTSSNIQEYIVRRFKKEKLATIRIAKLRLSNIKTEEITQILRGKSKQIKH